MEEAARETPGAGRYGRTVAAGLALLLAGCSAGTGPAADPPACSAGSALDGSVCRVFAVRTTERIPTPWVEAGHPLTLAMIVYKPLAPGPYPTLIFHHGSTGNGDDPSLFPLVFSSETVAKAFTDLGWMVLFPQRRGRGGSDGLYDEGFAPDRSRYSCLQEYALPGLTHALEDAEVIYQDVMARADVDTSRLLVGGTSRGGILAMAHAGQRPAAYRGILNFVGGWLGEGCVDAVPVNRGTFVAAAVAHRPSLWLYGENDPFYSTTHSRANFDAFVAAGGTGTYRLYRRANAAASGHLIFTEPSLWLGDVAAFVTQVAR
jgi:dienelactone hydrolase